MSGIIVEKRIGYDWYVTVVHIDGKEVLSGMVFGCSAQPTTKQLLDDLNLEFGEWDIIKLERGDYDQLKLLED